MNKAEPPDVEKLETEKDIPGLLAALDYLENWAVRRDAAEALGRVGDRSAIDDLTRAENQDDSPAVNIAAREAANAIVVRLVREALGGVSDNEARRLCQLYLRATNAG